MANKHPMGLEKIKEHELTAVKIRKIKTSYLKTKLNQI